MIVEFIVNNFRSIKDEQTFSLYAESGGTQLVDNVVQCPGPGDLNLLRSVGIYGANASGKSNLLLAFYELQGLIVDSKSLEDSAKIPSYQPYLLSEATKTQPVRFEIEFVVLDGTRYLYKLAFLRDKIVEERLSFFLTAKESVLFSRSESDTWETIKFGSLYKGGKKRFPFFGNNAYLSKAGSSADAPPMARDVYNYFRQDIVHIGVNENLGASGMDDARMLKQIEALLSYVDTGVAGVQREEKEMDATKYIFPPGMPKQAQEAFLRKMRMQFLFSHSTDEGGMERFEIGEESAGTRKLFELAPLLIDALQNGGTLLIDELDNSMHPFMAELVIKLFNDPEANRGKGQLIFTTHNIGLMSPELLRRDQIWFAEKTEGASRFYSLDDFDKKKVTPTSPFNRWYAEGRFGAVPKIDYQGLVAMLKEGAADAKEK